ncbi:hypothetical protein G6355_18130 [Vibrio cholerae]|uniref:hypothetical protein n=1 Tax=Vibrio cholerae TaxID=666 RepID=UPI000681D91A|nr:hypothetical protein [Vibrio cholerae]HBN6882355.1 hypothetical protein [Vibrio cholerae]HBN6886268.1 hypothetical protein [Vibrio cholerae]HBN6896865.1 hypothetical protein [Vibrio cholerae]HDI3249981.1 hypothetical protein [Vibrio cholerae]
MKNRILTAVLLTLSFGSNAYEMSEDERSQIEQLSVSHLNNLYTSIQNIEQSGDVAHVTAIHGMMNCTMTYKSFDGVWALNNIECGLAKAESKLASLPTVSEDNAKLFSSDVIIKFLDAQREWSESSRE